MTNFAIICSAKKFQGNLEVSDVLITYLINSQGRPGSDVHIGPSHSNYCQIINCSDMTYFAIICSINKFQTNLEVSEVLITHFTNMGKARVMLHIGASHSNNCHITLQLFGCDTFLNNLQHKETSKQIWRYQRY